MFACMFVDINEVIQARTIIPCRTPEILVPLLNMPFKPPYGYSPRYLSVFNVGLLYQELCSS